MVVLEPGQLTALGVGVEDVLAVPVLVPVPVVDAEDEANGLTSLAP